MLDWQLYGRRAGGHHATNLLFHCLNNLLLFSLCRRLTGAVWRSALVAALFALYPPTFNPSPGSLSGRTC